MPLRDKRSPRGFDWPAIVKTLLVEIAVLLALTGAFVFYVNWSSEVAFEEFMDATGSASIPVRAAKGRANCDRKG
jgi:hypothetical protein